MQLDIYEIPFESGSIKYRYACYLSEDGSRWIRHGLFTAFHENGAKASKLIYSHGVEEGECVDYHPNGQIAARGQYIAGKEHGVWHHWTEDGTQEPSTKFKQGLEQDE